jgi:hypothetical protein
MERIHCLHRVAGPDESSLATRSRMGTRPCSSGTEGDAYRASIIDALLLKIRAFLAILIFTGARGKKFQARFKARLSLVRCEYPGI